MSFDRPGPNGYCHDCLMWAGFGGSGHGPGWAEDRQAPGEHRAKHMSSPSSLPLPLEPPPLRPEDLLTSPWKHCSERPVRRCLAVGFVFSSLGRKIPRSLSLEPVGRLPTLGPNFLAAGGGPPPPGPLPNMVVEGVEGSSEVTGGRRKSLVMSCATIKAG